MGGIPGPVFMGDDSCLRGHGFESWRCIPNGHDIFFTLICYKNGVVCLKRLRINEKEAVLAHWASYHTICALQSRSFLFFSTTASSFWALTTSAFEYEKARKRNFAPTKKFRFLTSCLLRSTHFKIYWDPQEEVEASKQCDQIGQFIGLWETFQSLWQQIICPNFPHS